MSISTRYLLVCLIATNYPYLIMGQVPTSNLSGSSSCPEEILQIKHVYASGSHEVLVRFSAPVDTLQLEAGQFNIVPFGSPEILQIKDETTISITYRQFFNNNATYQLSIRDIVTKEGTGIPVLEHHFRFYLPEFGDVIITEFLNDPFPSVGLPEAEYIEVFNRLNIELALSDLEIRINERSIYLPPLILPAQEHAIICEEQTALLFGNDATCIPVANLPNILKENGTFNLVHPQTGLLHYVKYTSEWYKDKDKSGGGWSLEMMDYDHYCTMGENWVHSNHKSGGTPGRLNSVFDPSLHDGEFPKINWVAIHNDSAILIHFSEIVPPKTAFDRSHYTLGPNGLYPSNINFYRDDPLYTILSFSAAFKNDHEYILHVSDIEDCYGNGAKRHIEYPVALPRVPEPGDVVINEIMYEPGDGKPEYLELFNASVQYLDVSALSILRGVEHEVSGFDPITGFTIPMAPASYVVLAKDREALINGYDIPDDALLLSPSAMPVLSNTGGDVFLFDSSGMQIDWAKYYPDFHHPLVTNTRGVSLEKIHPLKPGNEGSNWSSASDNKDNATPGKQNSQYLDNNQGQVRFSMDTEVISPNEDGFHDRATITIELDRPGSVLNIRLYDAQGGFMGFVYNNFLCGTKNELYWTGKIEEDDVKTGLYVLFIELFHPSGEFFKTKVPCVVAR